MRTSHSPSLPILLLAAALLSAAGCASVRPTGDAIGRLEQTRAASPRSASAHRALGIAYYQNDRLTEARTALETATRLDPGDAVASLYLGMTAEAQNDIPAARAAYSTYVRVGRTRRVRSQLEERLALLARKELAVAAQSAVRREAELAGSPGSPTTVAVLPFHFTGPDSLRALERGFAELLTTDLARSSRLTVVERGRLQAILDEIALQQSGATETGTTVRAGRLLQAGRIVQGQLMLTDGSQLRADAAVVSVPRSEIETQRSDAQALEQLFTLEKNIVFGLFDALGVTLTTAERNAIERRPTQSLQAFLSYSRGLEAEDRGRYDEAARFYQDASRIDPGFGAAGLRSRGASAAGAAAGTPTAAVASGLNTAEGATVVAAAQGVIEAGGLGTAGEQAVAINPSTVGSAMGGLTTGVSAPGRDPSAGLGADNPALRGALVTVIIRFP